MERRRINIMEVCPRDGWQNLSDYIPLEDKLEYITGMLEAGVRHMQIGSLVSPRAVPQMKDTGEIAGIILKQFPDRNFNALVPNLKGAQSAWDNGLKEVSYIISVSESHNKANIGRTHEESWAGLKQIRQVLPELKVIVSLCTVFGCPFEGEVPFAQVMKFVHQAVDLGITKLEIADTIGVADPAQVGRYFATARKQYPQLTLYAHMHDTRNNGILNSWVAWESGADLIHTSLGGLGGCPFAPGASGNTSTEDFVWLLHRGNIDTGIDFEKIRAVARKMRARVAGNYSGHHVALEKDVFEAACRTQTAAA